MSFGTRGTSIWRLAPAPPFSEPGISGWTGRSEGLEESLVVSVGGRAGSAVTGALVLVSADIAGVQLARVQLRRRYDMSV